MSELTAEQASAVEELTPMVHRIAWAIGKNHLHYIEKEDLVSAGYLALCAAATRYDPEHAKGASLQTFAGWAVKGAVVDAIRAKRREMGTLRGKETGDAPRSVVQFQSLDAAEHEDGDQYTADIEAQSDIHGDVERANAHEFIIAAQESERDKEIARRILNNEPQAEIAWALGITESRVSQIQERIAANAREAIAEPSKTPVFTQSEASRQMEMALLRVGVGDTVSYAELAQVIGKDVFHARGLLANIRRRLLNEKQIVFGPVFGVGLRRLPDAELLTVGARSIKAVGRAAKRGAMVLASVQDFTALSNEQKVHHNTMLAQFGVLAHVVSEKVTKRIEAQASQPLALPQMFEAMKESL